MTILALLLVMLAAAAVVIWPLWQSIRKPWTLDIPQGAAEAVRQEQLTALEALRDLAMDFRLGKLSAADYRALAVPLQQQARQTMPVESASNHSGLNHAVSSVARAELDAMLEAQILAARQTVGSGATVGDATFGAAVNFCPQCGTQVTAEFRFCASCGAKLPAPDDVQSHRNGHVKPLPQLVKVDADHTADDASIAVRSDDEPTAPTTVPQPGADTHQPDVAVVTQPVQTPSQSTSAAEAQPARTGYRWWGIAAVIGAAWVIGVIWLFVSGRSGQLDQTPLATLAIRPLQALAVTDSRSVVAAPNEIQRSTDGQTWTAVSLTDPVRAIVALDATGESWLASGPTGLWSSQDGAASWQHVETEPPGLRLETLAAVPDQSDLLWGANARTLYVSHDGGATWEVANRALPGHAQALAAGSSDLFVGTDRGVFFSPNRGVSWTDYNGIVNGRIGSTNIQALAHDETGNLLFAGTSSGLYFMNLSSPGGWGQRSLDANVTSLALHGANREVLWVGAANGQLFRSGDRGVTWR